jgi:hypothetical protein
MSGNNVSVICPGCKKPNELRGKAMTLALTCKSCNIYFGVGEWNSDTVIFEHKEEPVIPLGSKGKVEKYKYEVIGFVVKQETKYRYKWREYLLFNPYRGFAFLSEYNGHWNFIWPIEQDPRKNLLSDDFYHEDNEYKLYQKYSADVIFARGEFFFDVVGVSNTTVNYEFISPPFVLALEKSEDSVMWCKGEYFTQNEISEIFSIPKSKLPEKEGIGYTQPFAGSFTRSSLIAVSIALILITVFAQILMTSVAEEKVVYHGEFNMTDLTDQKMFVTPTFELSDGTKSVEFYIEAPLSNDWFYGEFTLVNEDDGSEYNFSKEIEFYHGYEDGETWSEGSRVGEAYISQIPGGRYHVNIYPEFSMFNNSFKVIITRDITSNANMIFACLALLVFPVFVFIRGHYREVKRWSDSDYSPYQSE